MVNKQFTVKSDNKITSLEGVPHDWNILPLSKLCRQICDGTHYTPNYVENGVPFYSVENITRRDFENTKFISREEHLQLIKRCKPERGDILMTRIGSIGDCKLIDWDVDASIYVSLALLKPNECISSNYLYQYTKSKAFVSNVEKLALVNATPKKINMADIGKIEIPVPPSIVEQEYIAKSLSDIHELIYSLEKITKKKKNIKQGTMQELLTGKRKLKGFNGKWEKRELRKLGYFKSGSGFPEKYQGNETGEIPFFKVSDMNNFGNEIFMKNSNNYISKEINLNLKAFVFPRNSILFAKIGAAIFLERKRLLDQESCIDNNLMCFITNIEQIKSKFLYYVFLNISLGKLVEMTALPSLSGDNIGKLSIDYPIEYNEQESIIKILSDMDSEIQELETKRNKYIMIKNGMMQKLLTGEIRLT